MSTIQSDPVVRAPFTSVYSLRGSELPRQATVSLTLVNNPDSDDLHFVFVTDKPDIRTADGSEVRIKNPQQINVHTLLNDCYMYTPYSGLLVSNHYKTLTVFYDLEPEGSGRHIDTENRDRLALALDRLVARAQLACERANTTHRRDPVTGVISLRE